LFRLVFSMSRKRCASSAEPRWWMATVAPASCSLLAIAAPILRAPPETRATLRSRVASWCDKFRRRSVGDQNGLMTTPVFGKSLHAGVMAKYIVPILHNQVHDAPMLTSAAELPLPDPDSLAHSERVAAFIRKSIREAGGSISFAEFMQHALYAPGLGYYSAGAAKLGAGGDFITAPESSTLFAKVLARQCAPIFRTLASRDVLELGAGSGALAADLLKCFPELTRYRILEVSADLRQRQENLLRQQAPEHLGKVEWLDTLPRSFSGIVIANEVADALPVERFERAGDGLLQHRVVAKGEAFAWRRDPAP